MNSKIYGFGIILILHWRFELLDAVADDSKNYYGMFDCYYETVERDAEAGFSSSPNSRKPDICKPGFFQFPQDSVEDEADKEIIDIERSAMKVEDEDVVLCCPEFKQDQQERVFATRPVLWPNEKRGTLSRAFMECHTTNLPGLDSIRFLLYTKKNTAIFDYQELDMEDSSTFENSGFFRSAPVKIIIHGFMSSGYIGPANALRSAYNTQPGRINIISVHWEALANLVTASGGVCYDVAAQSTKLVGEKTASLIEYLVENHFTTLDKVHLLGHSLGAHCCGFAGKYLTIGKLPRITAFDPARPDFDNKGPSERLHLTDAEFVDVIHTATKQWSLLGTLTGGLLPFPVGMREPVGHRDFYPNRGTHQPGCYLQLKKLPVLCSHSRSYAYYADSIRYRNDRIFLAVPCKGLKQLEDGDCLESYVERSNGNQTTKSAATIMGEDTTRSPNDVGAIYYVKTSFMSPFPLDVISRG